MQQNVSGRLRWQILRYFGVYHDNFGIFYNNSCGAELPQENLKENKTGKKVFFNDTVIVLLMLHSNYLLDVRFLVVL